MRKTGRKRRGTARTEATGKRQTGGTGEKKERRTLLQRFPELKCQSESVFVKKIFFGSMTEPSLA